MKEFKQILSELPNSWETFTLKQFKKTLDIKISDSQNDIDAIFDGANNTVKLLAALTDIDEDYFENLPINQFKEIGQRVGFFYNTKPIPAKKSVLKCKKVNEISFNTYVLFMNNRNELHNISEMIQGVLKEKLSIEEIEDLSMAEVWCFFLLLKKHVSKFYKRTIQFTALKLIKVSLMNLLKMPLILIGKKKKP